MISTPTSTEAPGIQQAGVCLPTDPVPVHPGAFLAGQSAALVSMCEGLDVGLWVKCLTGEYKFVNSAYADLLGLAPEEILGRQDAELPLVVNPATSRRNDEAATGYVDVLVTDELILGKAGELQRVRVTRRRVLVGDTVIGVSGVVQKINLTSLTVERREQLLRQHYGQLAHELRTPLGGVLGLTRLVLSTGGLLENQERILRAVERCGMHLLALANDIVDTAELGVYSPSISPKPVDLTELLADVKDCLAPAALDRRVTLVFPPTANWPEQVIVDPLRLRQILFNLLGNAIRHTEDDFVALRVRLLGNQMAGVAGDQPRLHIEVEDGGSGMDASQVVALNTEWNHPLPNRCNRSRRGMGLQISNSLVRAMGGRMFVNSRLGHGTLVTFHILA